MAAKTNHWAVAAQLWHEAWQQLPSRHDWLFRAAVAHQSGRDVAQAKAALEEYLKEAPSDATDRVQARLRLEQLTAPAAGPGAPLPDSSPPLVPAEAKPATPVVQAPAPVPVVSAQPHVPLVSAQPQVPLVSAQPPGIVGTQAHAPTGAAGPLPLYGWATVGAGAASVLAGAGVYVAAMADRTALDERLAVVPESGLIEGIAWDDARQQADRIGRYKTVGAALVGAGALAAGLGAWLLVDRRQGQARAPYDVDVAWVPSAHGSAINLSKRF